MSRAGLGRRLRSALAALRGRLVALRVEMGVVGLLEYSVLGLSLILAILFRVMPLRWGGYFSTEADTAFQYRVTRYVVDNGYAAWLSWNDTLSWYPMGRDIPRTSFPGLPFTAAFLYSLLQGLGVQIPLSDLSLFFPVLMGVLTCVAVYLLGRDLGGGAVGVLAAFFMAVSPAFISRSSLGFFDTENLGIFGMVIIPLFFLRSIEGGKRRLWRALYALAAGLSLGYLHASWGASRYAIGLLSLYILASIPAKLYGRRHLASYAVTLGVGYLVAVMVPKLGVGFLLNTDNVAAAGFILFLLLFEAVRGRVRTGMALLVAAVVLAALAGGVIALESLGLIRPLAGKFLSVIDPSQRSTSPLIQSVAEHRLPAWSTFFSDFGFSIGLAILGAYFALRRGNDRGLFGLVFFLSSVYFAGSMIRLFLILSISVSLMAAYGVKELLAPFISITRRGAERIPRRRRAMAGVGREMGAVFVVIVFVASLPTLWSAAEISSSPSTMVSAGLPFTLDGRYPPDWLQALAWMRDNLPEDAVVASWWDYGYWIQTYSNKTTLADGATLNQTQIALLARIMMGNHTESLPILRSLGATHILVFGTYNPSDPNEELPFGDNAKWIWMARIGGLNETLYFDREGPTERFKQTTLYRLMKMEYDNAIFQLIFRSQNNFVLVYQIRE